MSHQHDYKPYRVLTPNQVARVLGVSREKVAIWSSRSNFPLPSIEARYAGHPVRRYILGDVDEWVRKGGMSHE